MFLLIFTAHAAASSPRLLLDRKAEEGKVPVDCRDSRKAADHSLDRLRESGVWNVQ